MERAIANADFPKTLAHYTNMFADRLGNLWVSETVASPEESASAAYTVYERSGRLLGTIAMPDGVTPLEVGDRYMIGLWRNEDEVEFVRVYDLIKR